MQTQPSLPDPRMSVKCVRHNCHVTQDGQRFRHRSNDRICDSTTFEISVVTTYERADVTGAIEKWKSGASGDDNGN